MKRILLFIAIIYLPGIVIFGQEVDKPMRREIEVHSEADTYQLLPFGRNGILLFYKSWHQGDAKARWQFSLYDVNFRDCWTSSVEINRYYELRLYDKNDHTLWLFLQKAVNKRQKDEFIILTVDIAAGTIRTLPGKSPARTDITAFSVMDNQAYCGGVTLPSKGAAAGQVFFTLTLVPLFSGYTLLKYHPSFFRVDLNNGSIICMPEKYNGSAWVDDMETDTLRKRILLSVKNHIPRKRNYMFLNQYDSEGKLLDSVMLKTESPGRKLNSAKLLRASDSVQVVIGTYNNKTRGYDANASNNAFRESSNGFFFARINNGKQDVIRFYNFSGLKSFYQTLSDKNAVRVKKKAIRMNARGREMAFDYQVLLHDIILYNDQLIAIAELYYPEYHNVTYTTYDAYGRPITSTYTVFDGYRYTNAIITAFDTEGRLLWDNSFEIWNILSYSLSERVNTLFDGEDIVLTYSSDGEIASKIISGGTVTVDKDYTPIRTNYRNDKLVSDYNSDMEYWYDNYFISYGYQKIKNTSEGGKSRRTVFYFNKIAFR